MSTGALIEVEGDGKLNEPRCKNMNEDVFNISFEPECCFSCCVGCEELNFPQTLFWIKFCCKMESVCQISYLKKKCQTAAAETQKNVRANEAQLRVSHLIWCCVHSERRWCLSTLSQWLIRSSANSIWPRALWTNSEEDKVPRTIW